MAVTLGALCDQIVPADDFPSASQAGVLIYIDHQLARVYARYQQDYRRGLELAEGMARSTYGRGVEELTVEQQLAWAGKIEHDDQGFFKLVREHAMEGYYGAPRHGGNKDAVSWHMLGLDEPPVRGRAQYNPKKEGAL